MLERIEQKEGKKGQFRQVALGGKHQGQSRHHQSSRQDKSWKKRHDEKVLPGATILHSVDIDKACLDASVQKVSPHW